VGDAWRDISAETIIYAFQRAKLLENFREPQQNFLEGSEAALRDLEEIEYDDPYLDDIQQQFADTTELEMEGNN